MARVTIVFVLSSLSLSKRIWTSDNVEIFCSIKETIAPLSTAQNESCRQHNNNKKYQNESLLESSCFFYFFYAIVNELSPSFSLVLKRQDFLAFLLFSIKFYKIVPSYRRVVSAIGCLTSKRLVC